MKSTKYDNTCVTLTMQNLLSYMFNSSKQTPTNGEICGEFFETDFLPGKETIKCYDLILSCTYSSELSMPFTSGIAILV